MRLNNPLAHWDIRASVMVQQPYHFINPRRACAARVTVLGLCLCVCVSACVFIRGTNNTNLGGGRKSEILSDFL